MAEAWPWTESLPPGPGTCPEPSVRASQPRSIKVLSSPQMDGGPDLWRGEEAAGARSQGTRAQPWLCPSPGSAQVPSDCRPLLPERATCPYPPLLVCVRGLGEPAICIERPQWMPGPVFPTIFQGSPFTILLLFTHSFPPHSTTIC